MGQLLSLNLHLLKFLNPEEYVFSPKDPKIEINPRKHESSTAQRNVLFLLGDSRGLNFLCRRFGTLCLFNL